MFCGNCGEELHDTAVCPKCEVVTEVKSPDDAATETAPKPVIPDNGGFLWGLLGFFVPVAGLILYLVWKYERPRTAKAVGVGALICVIVGVIATVLAAVAVGVYLLHNGGSLHGLGRGWFRR